MFNYILNGALLAMPRIVINGGQSNEKMQMVVIQKGDFYCM